MSAPRSTCRTGVSALVLATSLQVMTAGAAPNDRPSRAPFKDCTWEQLADTAVGLRAWVQRCDYGFRKIDFLITGNSLAVRFSDGGAPDPVVDVIGMNGGESPQAAIRRHFSANTPPATARRCTLARYRAEKPPAGVVRYTFVPNPAYRKELRATERPDEVGDPPCGDFGTMPDGIQYYEMPALNTARKVLFVRIGQDEPLFDEKTLRTIAPVRALVVK